MTQDELDRLPEWPTGFGTTEILVDGVMRRVPVAPRMVVFSRTDTDAIRMMDAYGDWWETGSYEGVLYKRRVL